MAVMVGQKKQGVLAAASKHVWCGEKVKWISHVTACIYVLNGVQIYVTSLHILCKKEAVVVVLVSFAWWSVGR